MPTKPTHPQNTKYLKTQQVIKAAHPTIHNHAFQVFHHSSEMFQNVSLAKNELADSKQKIKMLLR